MATEVATETRQTATEVSVETRQTVTEVTAVLASSSVSVSAWIGWPLDLSSADDADGCMRLERWQQWQERLHESPRRQRREWRR